MIYFSQTELLSKSSAYHMFFSIHILTNNWYWPSFALQKKNDSLLEDCQVKNIFKNILRGSFPFLSPPQHV